MGGGSGFLYEAGSLLPPVGVGLLFWFVMRAITRADRREREAEKEAEKELRQARAATPDDHPEDSERSS
jgi:flagellar biosynthesis/type III secretory pathway M-ring protein FliF/YscJ